MYWYMLHVYVYNGTSIPTNLKFSFQFSVKLFETPVISNRVVTHKQTCNSPNACTNWTLTYSVFFFFLGTEYLE